MSEYQFAILWRLLCLGGRACKWILSDIIINAFPSEYHKKARSELKELVTKNYVLQNTSNQICINPERFEDVKRLVNPDADPFIKEIKPIEDQIPEGYEPRPYFTTKGSHRVKGVIDNYCFYRKTTDQNYFVAFLISDGKIKSTINLGSIFSSDSLYRRALEKIDKLFGRRGFAKAQLREFGADIVGNRQPIKALIDLMVKEGYLMQTDTKHWERTPQVIPAAHTIDEFIEKESAVPPIQNDEKDEANVK